MTRFGGGMVGVKMGHGGREGLDVFFGQEVHS
jgi:hypothetical protein